MIDRKERNRILMEFDRRYRTGGCVVAGMDEVGRGPLAGNVVTACVVMPEEPPILWIDDSKKLSESRREKLFDEIMEHALYVGIGEVTPGDASSYSIAAASIIAKVTRDRQMIEMDRIYPEYGFARNKGYGTKEHIEALKRIGPCPIHRRSFIGHFV